MGLYGSPNLLYFSLFDGHREHEYKDNTLLDVSIGPLGEHVLELDGSAAVLNDSSGARVWAENHSNSIKKKKSIK